MPDTVRQRHDRFFHSVFSDTDVAAGFLRAVLPADVASQIAWHTLSRVTGDFVDPKLWKSETDLLFQADLVGEGPPLRTFLLLEHQSSPDRWMSHRLLGYCDSIWTEDRKRGSKKYLPPVVPVAFYQGRRPWKHSTRLSDLFRVEERGRPWIPPFDFLLLDQTRIGPAEVVGEEWGKLAQLLMMGAFQPDLEGATPEALAKREAIAAHAAALYVELEARGEEERLEVYFTYARAAVPHDILRPMGALMDQNGSPTGERVLTLEEWSRAEGDAQGHARGLAEGRAEGEQHATLSVVDGLLGAGASWTLIEKATGLNEARFLALKAELATA